MSDSPAVILYDASGNPLALKNGDALGSQSMVVVAGKSSQSDVARPFLLDDYGAIRAVLQSPVPPPESTPVAISPAENLLTIDGSASPSDTSYIIPNGKTFHLQVVLGGAEGDPSEKGSRMDVVYVDSNSVEHVITRIYLVGQTISSSFSDSSTARDGTVMSGNGVSTKIILRRVRLSNASQEVDGEVRGYVK